EGRGGPGRARRAGPVPEGHDVGRLPAGDGAARLHGRLHPLPRAALLAANDPRGREPADPGAGGRAAEGDSAAGAGDERGGGRLVAGGQVAGGQSLLTQSKRLAASRRLEFARLAQTESKGSDPIPPVEGL